MIQKSVFQIAKIFVLLRFCQDSFLKLLPMWSCFRSWLLDMKNKIDMDYRRFPMPLRPMQKTCLQYQEMTHNGTKYSLMKHSFSSVLFIKHSYLLRQYEIVKKSRENVGAREHECSFKKVSWLHWDMGKLKGILFTRISYTLWAIRYPCGPDDIFMNIFYLSLHT